MYLSNTVSSTRTLMRWKYFGNWVDIMHYISCSCFIQSRDILEKNKKYDADIAELDNEVCSFFLVFRVDFGKWHKITWAAFTSKPCLMMFLYLGRKLQLIF